MCVLTFLPLNSIVTERGTGGVGRFPGGQLSLLTDKVVKVVAPAPHPDKKVWVLVICDCVFCVSFMPKL